MPHSCLIVFQRFEASGPPPPWASRPPGGAKMAPSGSNIPPKGQSSRFKIRSSRWVPVIKIIEATLSPWKAPSWPREGQTCPPKGIYQRLRHALFIDHGALRGDVGLMIYKRSSHPGVIVPTALFDRGLHVFICITGATSPASWPWEATPRLHLYDGSDKPCKLAAGGDFSKH